MIDRSHRGPLPDARPLYFKVSEDRFWMLDKDEKLMECNWEEGSATWKPLNRQNCRRLEHLALEKIVFWKFMKQMERNDDYRLFCEDPEVLIDGIITLDADYSGVLPSARPLILAKNLGRVMTTRYFCYVLLEDRIFWCTFNSGFVHIWRCDSSSGPPILFTAKNVMELLKKPVCDKMNFDIRFEIFRDGLELFKKSILVLQNRLLISEKTDTEIWYIVDGVARKAVWREGSLSIYKEDDLRNSPPSLVFRYFAENPEKCGDSLTMELEEFRNCMEQFTIVSFDYSGLLTNDSPLVFVKNVIHHTCSTDPTRSPCECTEVSSVLVWFLWNGTRLTKCSWGKEEPKKVLFITDTSDDMEIPAILKSKEHLKNLLQAKYHDSSKFQWFGSVDDFLASLSDYVKLPFHFNGPFPEKRPLLFENGDMENPIYLIVRDDRTIIKCEWLHSFFSFSTYLFD